MAAPPSFDEFMAQVENATSSNQGIMVDEELYEELFAAAPPGQGARESFIATLKRPKGELEKDASCPVCLKSLAAIETEEEYALASESFFGDLEALGLRALPCPAKHVLCARCAQTWLALNNSCPMCRAVVDPEAPSAPTTGANVVEQQRQTERMLSLFHAVFGPRQPPAAAPEKGDSRDSFAGMYS